MPPPCTPQLPLRVCTSDAPTASAQSVIQNITNNLHSANSRALVKLVLFGPETVALDAGQKVRISTRPIKFP